MCVMVNHLIRSIFRYLTDKSKRKTSHRDITWYKRTKKIIERQNKFFPQPEFDNWNECDELILTAEKVCEQIIKDNILITSSADLTYKVALFKNEKAEYINALKLYLKSLDISKKLFGKKHSVVGSCYNQIGIVYLNLKNFKQAEFYFKKSSAITNHLVTYDTILDKRNIYYSEETLLAMAMDALEADIMDLFNQAELCKIKGNPEKALSLYNKALEKAEKHLEKNHLLVARILNNIAGVYQILNINEQAELLFRRVLYIYELNYGKEHPNIADTLNNLGCHYRLIKRYNEAESFHLKSLEVGKKVYGDKHPKVAIFQNNLAVNYGFQEQYDKAEDIYISSLSIMENVFGNNHPDVAQILNNLAIIYERNHDYEKSHNMFIRALSIREEFFHGINHPDLAQSLINLAGSYMVLNKLEEAEPLIIRGIEMMEKALGKQHPRSINAREYYIALQELKNNRQILDKI